MPRRRGTPPARGAGARRGELLLHSLLGLGLVATGRAAAEGAATATTARRAGPRPNVVLVLADDLGAETVGAYGGEDYRTPALDRLAAQGMLFADAHAYPRCVCGGPRRRSRRRRPTVAARSGLTPSPPLPLAAARRREAR